MTTSTRAVFVGVAVAASLVAPATARGDGIMLVSAGAFWMGRDDGPAEERPRHRVFVTDFWIERHKVTNAEFADFLNAQGIVSPERERRYDEDDAHARIHLIRLGTPPHPKDGQPVRWIADRGHERSPAVVVSWFGARESAAGEAGGCPPRRSGRSQRAETTASRTCSSGRGSGRPRSSRRTLIVTTMAESRSSARDAW